MFFRTAPIKIRFVFLDLADVSSLAYLCQEYQVDWLLDKIKDYLSKVQITDLSLQLRYLHLLEGIGFGNLELLENNLLNQVTDIFLDIQSNPLFSSCERRLQIMVARKRLWFLLDNVDSDTKLTFLNTGNVGLLSIFKKYKQTPIKFALNQSEQNEKTVLYGYNQPLWSAPVLLQEQEQQRKSQLLPAANNQGNRRGGGRRR